MTRDFPYKDINNPDWEGKTVKFCWGKEVPLTVRVLWETFNDAQKVAIAGWAGALALQRQDETP